MGDESSMQPLSTGDRGPAVADVHAVLRGLGLLPDAGGNGASDSPSGISADSSHARPSGLRSAGSPITTAGSAIRTSAASSAAGSRAGTGQHRGLRLFDGIAGIFQRFLRLCTKKPNLTADDTDNTDLHGSKKFNRIILNL